MKLLLKLVVTVAMNALGFYLASRYIDGFTITSLPTTFPGTFAAWEPLLIIALIFTALNIIVKPLLKLVLSPVIILTLGLGLILVNALVLYFLTFFTKDLRIDNVAALLLASLLIGVVGFVSHRITK